MKYSLIIPVYNEESMIPELYRRVSEVMDQLDGDSELILINDGSRDRTNPPKNSNRYGRTNCDRPTLHPNDFLHNCSQQQIHPRYHPHHRQIHSKSEAL